MEIIKISHFIGDDVYVISYKGFDIITHKNNFSKVQESIDDAIATNDLSEIVSKETLLEFKDAWENKRIIRCK